MSPGHAREASDTQAAEVSDSDRMSTLPTSTDIPAWARSESSPRWPTWARNALALLATAGWAVALALFFYSHGQNDRLAITQEDMHTSIAALTQNISNTEILQSYLATPRLHVQQLQAAQSHGPLTSTALLWVPNFVHGMIVARGLAVLPADQVYAVWGQEGSSELFQRLGALVTTAPHGDGLALVVGRIPLEHYRMLSLSIEQATNVTQPTSPLLFSIHPGKS